MAWTYSDYVTMSGTARRTRLALHIQEVSDRISENRSFEGMSTNTSPLNEYLKQLLAEHKRLGGTGAGLKVMYPVKQLGDDS